MSVSSSIAEGSGHASQAQFYRYLTLAMASAREMDYQLLLAHDLRLFTQREYAHLEARGTEVQKMLIGLKKKVAETKGKPDSTKPGLRPPMASLHP